MAERARLSPPRQVKQSWPWHNVRSTSLSSSVLAAGDRRFEGHAYLADGYGLRLAFEEQAQGWSRVGELANAWMPNRLKGNIAAPGTGEPYLSATQVFDLRPTPRKFIVVTEELRDQLSVSPGEILVTRSGTVGRVTFSHRLHEGMVLSDDLLRVACTDPAQKGWVYAYLKTPTARRMMRSAHYGHMIKHLEPHHLMALPIPLVSDETAADYARRLDRILSLRNKSYDRILEAELKFEQSVGWSDESSERANCITISSEEAFAKRRRFEASYYAGPVRSILNHFEQSGLKTDPLGNLSEGVWWGARFKRFFGEGGRPYFSADDLWTLNPRAQKHILLDYNQAADPEPYMVKAGWLIMACSGQVYGLNGSVDLVTDKLTKSFLSHDLIRIVPKTAISGGYLLVALGHPKLGRPLVIRNAYGSSIPHLDPDDIAATPIVRLNSSAEKEIGAIAEEAIQLRHEADEMENELERDAESRVQDFLARRAGAPI